VVAFCLCLVRSCGVWAVLVVYSSEVWQVLYGGATHCRVWVQKGAVKVCRVMVRLGCARYGKAMVKRSMVLSCAGKARLSGVIFSLGKAKLGRSGYWYSEVAYWLCCLCNAMFCRDLFSIWKEMEGCVK
jgi:hypothetical protein